MTLKSSGKFGPKLNANFQISPPKIGQFVSSCQKGYKFEIWLVSFVWKVHSLNQKISHKFYLVTLKGCGKSGPKLNANFQISPTKIGQFVSSGQKGYKFQFLSVSFVWKVHSLNQKLSQKFDLVTLKGCGKFGPKLNAAFQISPPKIGQLLSSSLIVSKLEILLVSFVWKVH